MRKNFFYKKYYVFWSKLILMELVPYFAIIILNALILGKTLKAARFRKKFGHIGGSTAQSQAGTTGTSGGTERSVGRGNGSLEVTTTVGRRRTTEVYELSEFKPGEQARSIEIRVDLSYISY